MSQSSHNEALSALQEHTEFLQRLARGLLLDPGRAEDALQETWLVAARQDGRVTRHWLAGVVRRVASQMRRGESRRLYRERKSARPESVPSTADSVERLEVTQRLVCAVKELPEPYRSVLLLRYFDDLSASEIGRRRGLPVTSVHTQLRRGLQRLRETLLADEGTDARTLLTGLLPLADSSLSLSPLPVVAPSGLESVGLTPGTSSLVTLMNSPCKLCAAAVLCVGFSLVGWRAWGSEARGSEGPADLTALALGTALRNLEEAYPVSPWSCRRGAATKRRGIQNSRPR